MRILTKQGSISRYRTQLMIKIIRRIAIPSLSILNLSLALSIALTKDVLGAEHIMDSVR